MEIKLEHVSKRYGEQLVLNNINYTFHAPRLYVILGPSGSGKTTLLNILARIEKPSSGSVCYPTYKNPRVGVVFQHHYLIGELTCFENIVLPLLIQKKKVNSDEIFQLAKKLNIENLMHRQVSYCSGGETQRVNIARTLALNPDYILADEPTGSVDEETAAFIRTMLVELAESKLVIVVTHDLSLFSHLKATYIRLEQGKLV